MLFMLSEQDRRGCFLPHTLPTWKDNTRYCYGWDLTKNICEIYSTTGYIHTVYTYTPYGEVTSSGNVTQPVQWSSEHADTELGLAYYNYRYYNPTDGRWTRKDPIGVQGGMNLYRYALNSPYSRVDSLGLFLFGSSQCQPTPCSSEAMAAADKVMETEIAAIKNNKTASESYAHEVIEFMKPEVVIIEVHENTNKGRKYDCTPCHRPKGYKKCIEIVKFSFSLFVRYMKIPGGAALVEQMEKRLSNNEDIQSILNSLELQLHFNPIFSEETITIKGGKEEVPCGG